MRLRSLGLSFASPLLALLGLALVWGPGSILLASPAVPGPVAVKVGLVVLLGPAATAGGWLYGERLESRAWQATARQFDLTPQTGTGGLLRQPALAGTVDGRTVTVSQQFRQTQRRRQTRNKPFTHVEATVQPPAEQGVVVFPNDGSNRLVDVLEVSEDATLVHDEEFVAVGYSDLCTRAVVSGAARQALLDAGKPAVWVGDPSEAFTDGATGLSDVPVGGESLAESYLEAMTHDPALATNRGNDDPLYGEELEREIRAVVAAADAFEDARTRASQYA